MNNQSTDKRVPLETVVWWFSIAIVSGMLIAAVITAG